MASTTRQKRGDSGTSSKRHEAKSGAPARHRGASTSRFVGQQESTPKEAHRAPERAGESLFSGRIVALLVLAVALLIFNQFLISSVYALAGSSQRSSSFSGGTADLSSVNIDNLQSTAQTLAAVYPELQSAKTSDDVMAILFPTGTPEYGQALGVSFDDPVNSLAKLSQMFPALRAEVQSKNPEAFKRFVNLASNPKGISCEYCCGVGPAGADKNGNSVCGCQHNPALLSVALYLSAYTDYTDAQILREVMHWKTLFFPQNMVELGTKISGGDTSVLQSLPGMVGGC